jgi:hypothetical protein
MAKLKVNQAVLGLTRTPTWTMNSKHTQRPSFQRITVNRAELDNSEELIEERP